MEKESRYMLYEETVLMISHLKKTLPYYHNDYIARLSNHWSTEVTDIMPKKSKCTLLQIYKRFENCI